MEAVKLLLENGAKVNSMNGFGMYPLHAAISSGNQNLYSISNDYHRKIIINQHFEVELKETLWSLI